ncbi:hypothetical protein TNCV_4305401 [Trichonephila clavipes]|nr:hypothetical protein TNCV_4305401 [Trichonephila clavipes]
MISCNHVPLMQRLPGVNFNKTMFGLTRQGCHKTHKSPDVSPIEHIWDHLGWRVGQFTSLNELKTTTNMKRNASRHHTLLVCLNARSYRIVPSR